MNGGVDCCVMVWFPLDPGRGGPGLLHADAQRLQTHCQVDQLWIQFHWAHFPAFEIPIGMPGLLRLSSDSGEASG